MYKKIIGLIVGVILSVISTSNVIAEENTSGINLCSLPRTELTVEMIKLTDYIINNDMGMVLAKSDYFTGDTMSRIEAYINGNREMFSTSGTKVIDFIEPSNSQTGDLVVMVNSKEKIDDNRNILVLYEFHLNKLGKIYGFNVWRF